MMEELNQDIILATYLIKRKINGVNVMIEQLHILNGIKSVKMLLEKQILYLMLQGLSMKKEIG